MKETIVEIQIRFADCDTYGHINNVNLQHYFDLGKSDYAKKVFDLEFSYSKLGLITVNTANNFLAQTRLYDKIFVKTGVEKIGTKSVTFVQSIVSDSGEVKAESRSVLVGYDFELQQTIEVPDVWRTLI